MKVSQNGRLSTFTYAEFSEKKCPLTTTQELN